MFALRCEKKIKEDDMYVKINEKSVKLVSHLWYIVLIIHRLPSNYKEFY